MGSKIPERLPTLYSPILRNSDSPFQRKIEESNPRPIERPVGSEIPERLPTEGRQNLELTRCTLINTNFGWGPVRWYLVATQRGWSFSHSLWVAQRAVPYGHKTRLSIFSAFDPAQFLSFNNVGIPTTESKFQNFFTSRKEDVPLLPIHPYE